MKTYTLAIGLLFLNLVSFSQISVTTYVYKDTLKLDIYQANTNQNNPLLVVVHGGGFSAGVRNSPLESKFCYTMAAKGFTVASIDYRLTLKGKSFGCDCPSKEKMNTFVAASEDIQHALSYLNASPIKYNKNQVILLGSSAGAEAVLNTAFMMNHPNFSNINHNNIAIAGVVSLAGAMVDVNYITQKNAVPTLLIHGVKDSLVPFATSPHHYCSKKAVGYIMLDGPQTIAKKLKSLHISYILAYDTEGTHDWSNLGYDYTTLIASFINEAIINQKLTQSEIDITKLKIDY